MLTQCKQYLLRIGAIAGVGLLILLIEALSLVQGKAQAPRTLKVHGVVHVADSLHAQVPYAQVTIQCSSHTRTQHYTVDSTGRYLLHVVCQPGDSLTIHGQSLGFIPFEKVYYVDTSTWLAGSLQYNIALESTVVPIEAAWVSAKGGAPVVTMQKVQLKNWTPLQSGMGGIESVIKALPGVHSRNELSTQYSVRGGSYDENLVYIDGVEVHRPTLIRSGQQEGLSVINPDLVERLEFSAGAFPARYGERLSSVLDIYYRQPKQWGAKLQASLLENRLYLEGGNAKFPLSAMVGARYKDTRLLLKTTNDRGEYRPIFFDVQSKVYFKPKPSLTLILSTLYSHNTYHCIPYKKETQVGSLLGGMKSLRVYYEGNEKDHYQTLLNALTLRWSPLPKLSISTSLPITWQKERERFDILGEYWLADVEPLNAATPHNDSASNVGIGSAFDHANNTYQALAIAPKAYMQYSWHNGLILRSGLGYQYRQLKHALNEWQLQDSAGYSLPFLYTAPIELFGSRYALDTIALHTLSSFIQTEWLVPLAGVDLGIVAGIRCTHTVGIKHLQVSPRASVSFVPHAVRHLSLYVAGGLYYQYPYYREMMDPTGSLHPHIQPQRAIHALIGGRWSFTLRERPFSLQAEAYYKILHQMIPYRVHNLLLQYEGENVTKGSVMGIDFRINGELVPGTESWIAFSFMHAQQRFTSPLSSHEPTPTGSFPSPQDQRFAAKLFLQDYIPFVPTLRVHLSATYATGVPFTPLHLPYGKVVRMPSYRRVDMGFTWLLKDPWYSLRWIQSAHWLKQLSISAEVLNLFNFKNTASYLWIRVPSSTGEVQQLAVPNHLTFRCFNIRLNIAF